MGGRQEISRICLRLRQLYWIIERNSTTQVRTQATDVPDNPEASLDNGIQLMDLKIQSSSLCFCRLSSPV